MRKRENRPETIPEIRSNAKDVSWVLGFICAAKVLADSITNMADRYEAICAKDEIEDIRREVHQIANDLILTFPQEKRKTIRNQMNSLYFHMDVAPIVSGKDGTKTVVEVDVLGTIMESAHDQCVLCPTPERCRTCALGRAFDRCAPQTRGKKESWADIDIR